MTVHEGASEPGYGDVFAAGPLQQGRSMARVARKWPAVLLALGLLMQACASVGDDNGAGVGDEATAENAGEAGDVEDAEAESGVLRFAEHSSITTFDPHRAPSSWYNTMLFLTYDRLVHLDVDAEPIPGLAEDWEYAEGAESLDLFLREGVTFHDGEPFDAEAVKANIERATTIEDTAVGSELASVEETEVLDEHTVRLHLNTADSSLLGTLSDRAGAMVSPAAFDDPDALDTQPVGAGMFVVNDYQEGVSASYEAYDDYWDPDAVQLSGVEMMIEEDSQTRWNALQSGQIDATTLAESRVEEAESAGFNVMTESTQAFYRLALNRSREVFEDERVRRALNHAIDREGLVEGVAFGHGEPTVQHIAEGLYGHDPELDIDTYEYDPDLARELLAEAGYEDGFSFEMIALTRKQETQLAEAVQGQLAQVGIDAELRVMEASRLSDAWYVEEQSDAFVFNWGGRPEPTETLGLLFSPDSFFNSGGHSTNEFVELHAEALATEARDTRESILHDISEHFVDESLEVMLYHEQTPRVYSDDVAGWEVYASGKDEFRGVSVSR